MAKDKVVGKITYNDVKAGEDEVNLKEASFEALLQKAILRFGTIGKKLSRKKAAEAANKMADWIAEQLLTEGDHNPLYDAKVDAEYLKAIRGESSKFTPYKAHMYVMEKKGFNRGRFVQDAKSTGLAKESIHQMVARQSELYRSTHRQAATADVNEDNLSSVLNEIEKERGFKFSAPERVYDRAITHVLAYREGTMSADYAEKTPGITKKKKAA